MRWYFKLLFRKCQQTLDILSKYPHYGYRKVSLESKEIGLYIKEKRTRRLMHKMGVCAIYPRPNLSRISKGGYKYLYFLKDMAIKRVNQVWAADTFRRSGISYSDSRYI